MANLIAINDLIPLTDESLYCQPRVALFMPAGNDTMSSTSNNYYYVVLVDLPNNPNYPAPVFPPALQADGSLFYPYTCADGTLPPDTLPPGTPMITYALPVWGGNPTYQIDGDLDIYPPVYFGIIDPKHKGTVIVPNTVSKPVMPPWPVYACGTMVIKSATNTSQLWVGNLVYINEVDTCTSFTSSGANVSLIVQQGGLPGPNCISFQGFLSGSLQPTVSGGVNTVNVVFAPFNDPSLQPPAQFSYTFAVTIL